jgi:hemoglobin/transferrin/lactoferrin receptor protein
MKLLFCMLLSMLFTSAVQAQLITVRDAESGEPLELVHIYRTNPEVLKRTNAYGQFDGERFKDASVIILRLVGYQELKTTFKEIEANGFQLLMKPTSLLLDHVIVSASRSEQLNKDLPIRVKVITPKDIALQNPQTTADLLGASGEVFIQKSQQGGGSPMIRGFATNRLLIAVDGVRMNNAVFRGGNIQQIISIDPFNIESAEVYFGPSSVIYGSDAIGGVMSFQTLKPQLSLNNDPFIKGQVAGRYASANNEIAGHADINVGWKKWAILTSISHNKYGDLRMGSNGPDDYLRTFSVTRQDSADVVVPNSDPNLQLNSGFHQTGLMQKIRFKPNEKWDFYFAFHYNETSDYDRYDRLIETTSNGLPRHAEWRYGPQKWMMNHLTITNYARGKVYDQMTIRLAQQRFEESRTDRRFNQNRRRHRMEHVDAYSLNVDFFKNLGERHKLFYGVEGVFNQISSFGDDVNINTGVTTAAQTRYPDSDWGSYAAYLSHQFKISEKLTLNSGVRYNQFVINASFDTTFIPLPVTETQISFGALNGNLGLVARPGKTWTIQVNLSTAYRTPNIDDIGKVFDSEPGKVVVPNPNLKAEYAYNADLGVSKLFGEWLKLDATGYFTYLNNALVRRNFQLNGLDSINYDGALSQVQAIQNASFAYVYGVQAGMDVQFGKGFRLSSRINYQMGREEMDDGSISRSRHAAPLFGQTRLSYGFKNLKLEFYALYNGQITATDLPIEEQGKPALYAKDENGNPYAPSWYTLNFRMGYQVTSHLYVTAALENITDQRYRTYSSGLAAAGRNFIVSARIKF